MTEHEKTTHQRKRLSANARRWLTTGIILVLLPCLGLGGGIAFFNARQAGKLSRWRSLGSPPSPGVEILTGDMGVVYLRTATDSIFGCEHRRMARPAENCWSETQEPVSIDEDATFEDNLFHDEVVSPSGTVVDSLNVTVWRAEDTFETRYALLDDGTVWKWEYDVGAYFSLFVLALGPVLGLALGLIVVLFVWAVAGLRSLWRHMT